MRRRQGFTLVELLVAMALIMFVMVILTQAFTASLRAFQILKATGDMDSRLRMVGAIMTSDLRADHFEGRKRLSDLNFWAAGPPREGFIRIYQGSPLSTTNPNAPYYQENSDGNGDNFPSNRAIDHRLHLTVKKRGNNRGDYFIASILDPLGSTFPSANTTFFAQPSDAKYQDVPNTYTSQWAEVAYFLINNGATTPGGIPLFALYRRQMLLVSNDLAVNWNTPFSVCDFNYAYPPGQVVNRHYPYYADMSFWKWPTYPGDPPIPPPPSPLPKPPLVSGPSFVFNTPTSITVPERRFGGLLGNYTPLEDVNFQPTGGDILVSDVLSFEIKVLLQDPITNQRNGDFVNLYDTSTPVSPVSFQVGINPAFSGANGPRVFDTWSNVNDGTYNYSNYANATDTTAFPMVANPPRILALLITVRVWEYKTQQTRQISIVQDM